MNKILASLILLFIAGDIASQSLKDEDIDKAFLIRRALIFQLKKIKLLNEGKEADLVTTKVSSKKPAIDQWNDLFIEAGLFTQVHPALLKAVCKVESNGNQFAESHRNAKGLMQILPSTAENLGIYGSQIWDPRVNIYGGARYLREMWNKFENLKKTLWAYNAGPHSVEKEKMPEETRQYIKNVLEYFRHYREEGFGSELRRVENMIPFNKAYPVVDNEKENPLLYLIKKRTSLTENILKKYH